MADVNFLQHTFGMDGKVALVTGASSGLGAHACATLARAGCAVALCARRRVELESLAAKLATFGARALPVVMDVTSRRSVDAALDEILAQFGRVDVLINNAGIAASRKFAAMSEDDWRAVLDTDLTAVWRVGQAVARQMTAQQTGGVIVNIASILGVAPGVGNANYGAAKAGVLHLTKTMAVELASGKIRVNALAPGYFATEMNREFLHSARGRDYIAKLLPQRAGQLAELDGALLLLASPAGNYINGAVIVVDGGALLTM